MKNELAQHKLFVNLIVITIKLINFGADAVY